MTGGGSSSAFPIKGTCSLDDIQKTFSIEAVTDAFYKDFKPKFDSLFVYLIYALMKSEKF